MKAFKIAIIGTLALLAGCATLQKIWGSSATQTGIQVAIDIGVGLVLANNPGEAGPLNEAATALQQFASGSTTTLASFVAAADAKINGMPSLNAPEKLALQSIVTLAASALTTGAGALPPATAVDLATVFADIANAAAAYTTASPKAASMGLVRK